MDASLNAGLHDAENSSVEIEQGDQGGPGSYHPLEWSFEISHIFPFVLRNEKMRNKELRQPSKQARLLFNPP
jgi:hypothetical protein